MTFSASRFFAAALLAASFVVGCGGGGAKVQQSTTTTTMGQELIDLKESHDRGIITDEEYKKAKKEIMNRYE